MSDRIPPHRVARRTLALGFVALSALVVVTAAASHPRIISPGAVIVDGVPPDACVAVYGAGPCREHGTTINGSTDAIAGPPPTGWHGKVQEPPALEARP